MDSTDKDILIELQKDARLTMTSLGKLIGLSQPAVTERVKRLEEQGIISDYHTSISNEKIGKPMIAFILFQTNQCLEFVDYCKNSPAIIDCHRISGEYNYLLKVVIESTKELELLEDGIIKYGSFTTMITLSSPIENKALIPSSMVIKE